MGNDEGYEIRLNGVPRTYRDRREVAFEAARYAKSRNPADVVEIIERATGTKIVVLADGRTS